MGRVEKHIIAMTVKKGLLFNEYKLFFDGKKVVSTSKKTLLGKLWYWRKR